LVMIWINLGSSIRVSMMLPLNTVDPSTNTLNNRDQLIQYLGQMKQGGLRGVMCDFWWGLVEEAGPGQYNWSAYLDLANLVKNAGLHLQIVMSFHQCGTNIGDLCYIPLPPWVIKIGNSNGDIFYRDESFSSDQEYLSLGVDNQTLFYGRTAVQMYADYMQNFSDTFSQFIPDVINQVQVGLGPAGEMRYPSYQLQGGKWSYCGIGEFQCYDKYMLADLMDAATNAGHPEWGTGGPNDAGTYDSIPSNTGFFSDGSFDNYDSDYGQFFLEWYSGKLLDHGSAILSEAHQIFAPLGVSVAAKVSGIHWWYATDSHAAECTAGYMNTNNNDAYLQIAQMFAKNNVEFDFTALEMVDQPNNGCGSAPQELVKQTILASHSAGISYAGENALPICNPNCYQGGFDEVYTESTQYGSIDRFTYLRLTDDLMNNQNNWNMFVSFVQRMANSKRMF